MIALGSDSKQIHRWHRAMDDGDLEKNPIPRQTGSMATDDVREIVRLRDQAEQLKTHLADDQDHVSFLNQQLHGKELTSTADGNLIHRDYEHRLAQSKKQQEELHPS